MRKLVANSDIKCLMAMYGVTVTEWAALKGRGRCHLSVLLNKELRQNKHDELKAELWEIIEED